MHRPKPRANRSLPAGLLVATIVAAASSGSVVATDAPSEPTLKVHFRPAVLALEVGGRARVRVYVCPRVEAAFGADQQPGTRDDDCERGSASALDTSDGISAERQGRDGFRWRITAEEPGVAIATAVVDAAEDGSMSIFVAEPVPADDPGAIGTRDRRSGDIDADGRITNADVRGLAAAISAAPGGFVAAADPTLPVSANVLGGPFITAADVAELEARARHERVRGRALERARIDITPRDIVPIHAGGVGIVGVVLDASNRVDLPGTFGVNLVGGDRLYYDGPGGWGGVGEVPVAIVYEQPSFMVFTVPAPGFGFVGHQRPNEDITRTVSFEAVEPGEALALPPAGGRLTVPLDVDRDIDLDWDDYVTMLVSLGMRAGDRGFPARGDVNADGVITLADIDSIAPAVALFGPSPIGGPPGSGDIDGDGDLDARDVRGALAHLHADRETGRSIIADALPDADELRQLADELAMPQALDVDGDGAFGAGDVGAMATTAGVELGSLGPYYLGLEDARRVPPSPGSEALDLDGNGMLGPGDVADLLAAIDDALAGRIEDPELLERFDLDGDGRVAITDIDPLRVAITEAPASDG